MYGYYAFACMCVCMPVAPSIHTSFATTEMVGIERSFILILASIPQVAAFLSTVAHLAVRLIAHLAVHILISVLTTLHVKIVVGNLQVTVVTEHIIATLGAEHRQESKCLSTIKFYGIYS